MAEKRQKPKTIKARNKYRAIKAGMITGIFASPLVPASVIIGVNWDEWFNKAGASLPMGFACLLLTVATAIVGILKSNVIFKKVDIALYSLAGFFLLIGITNLFLASLFVTMGKMWIFVGCGLIGSGGFYTVNQKVVEPNLKMYNDLIKENCLDAKSKRQAKREEQARKDAEEDAKRVAFE